MLSLRYIIKGQSKELGLEDRFWKRKSFVTARKNIHLITAHKRTNQKRTQPTAVNPEHETPKP